MGVQQSYSGNEQSHTWSQPSTRREGPASLSPPLPLPLSLPLSLSLSTSKIQRPSPPSFSSLPASLAPPSAIFSQFPQNFIERHSNTMHFCSNDFEVSTPSLSSVSTSLLSLSLSLPPLPPFVESCLSSPLLFTPLTLPHSVLNSPSSRLPLISSLSLSLSSRFR